MCTLAPYPTTLTKTGNRKKSPARLEAEEELARARAQVRALTIGAETRIRAALSRYEAQQQQLREAEAGEVEAAAQECRAAAQAAVRGAWDRMLSEVVEEFWPTQSEG